MIQRVEIDNFALVEHAELDLGPGLTVLTGETGAGKSILVDALEFASGGRSERAMLRTGAREAVVSILFDSFEKKEDELLIVRCLKETGRSYAKINNQLSTVGELGGRMELLLAIHSQNDQQTIFRESVHQSLLDAYDASTVIPLLQGWSASRDQFVKIEIRLGELFLDPETRDRRRSILSFQADEISKASLTVGEDQALLTQIKKLTAVREITNHLGRALEELAGSEDDSASSRLGRALMELTAASRYSSRIQELCERMELIKTDLTELGYDLARVAQRLDDRPDALEQANERLASLRRLQDKYGSDLEDVIAYGDKARAELERLDQTQAELARLTQEKEELLTELKEHSDRLYEVRREAADRLSLAINGELTDLDMKNAYFSVDIDRREITDKHIPLDPHSIRFSIAPNPGEPAMPLVSIISGGEASRVLLAIKTVLSSLDGVPTLIFDEIDTGISGKTTTMIAEKLKSIALHKQVICVTHSAQIAACADYQLRIGKKVEGGRTRTTVERIDGAERVSEIARLLSGRPDDLKSRELAQDLLARHLEWSPGKSQA
ncbi:MAG TPA: DNA repair protein RecN [Clostridia bacterium]|nr:DNA repair protein RecN [Clostridia bacterium]